MSDWAAKVLAGVPRYDPFWNRLVMITAKDGDYVEYDDALAALAKLGAGDGLVDRATAALEGVTDGPWAVEYKDGTIRLLMGNEVAMCDEKYYPWTPENDKDWHFIAFTRQWVPEAADRIAALTAQVAENRISEPHDPGDFVGDIYFGHPVKTTMGTHRWTGSEWVKLPSETEALMGLLADARSERDALRAKVARLAAAVMWARDRIAVDSGMTEAEAKRTADELLNVLRGEPSPASNYAPETWQSPTRAALTDGGKDG